MHKHNEDQWLLKPEVANRLRISHSTVERGVRQGWFPKPQKIGLRKIAWRASAIAAYEASRVSSTLDLKPQHVADRDAGQC
ncbi:helix-turn-helix transcriptional regulator [Bosea sp. (in: a-proteobacteria)]|uniref:helix-turn-helix transcriptional regulator n=1 Tax=Bosea sp. (in: a-proteobacteria) TaxID=1871050 RepID=UPI003A5CAFA3